MGAKKNQTYKPRQGGTNRNLANYTPEQLEFTKNYNEELFHIFGYVKDDERLPENNTPFMDFEGNACPKSVEKLNYFRKLNDKAVAKRKLSLSQKFEKERNISVGPDVEGGIKLVRHMEIMSHLDVLDHIEFVH